MKAPSLLAALAPILLAASASATQTQTLGPWEVQPPDSAVLIAGGGSNWSSLNVVNSGVSLDTAFTGLPVDDDGYANGDNGTIVELTFTAGVLNGPGDDLVMFDSQYDAGAYLISSDFDGFAAKVLADTSGGTIVSAKSYYYFGSGPYPANVVGRAVDLSAIGVPGGTSVTRVRFECAAASNTACDPIALCKIVEGPTLTISPIPLVAGAAGTAAVAGATAGGTVGIAYSLAGGGPTSVPAGSCGTLTVALSLPIRVLALGAANASGDFSVGGNVPAGLSGRTVHAQALDFATCTLTNGVTAPVL